MNLSLFVGERRNLLIILRFVCRLPKHLVEKWKLQSFLCQVMPHIQTSGKHYGHFSFPWLFWCPIEASLRKWLWVSVERGVCNVGGSIFKVASGKGCAGQLKLKIGSPLYADCHVNLCYLFFFSQMAINSKSHHNVHFPLLNNFTSIIQYDIMFKKLFYSNSIKLYIYHIKYII